ncbi:hypothetical protein Agabi119p4_10082 [Agaricus bisporus var. burnettii]|uniref:Uncharacterized protein n=1 Tax=Agaricus bisporus var. burnettii TaxID=192524 RepID=A0A8H7EVZ3_AGABI|nr:hypothetical protein Agabi119p4_10082 [Agaricus bisporus var. burnettii]
MESWKDDISYITSTSDRQLLEAHQPVFQAETIEEENMAFVPTSRTLRATMLGELILIWGSPTSQHTE